MWLKDRNEDGSQDGEESLWIFLVGEEILVTATESCDWEQVFQKMGCYAKGISVRGIQCWQR